MLYGLYVIYLFVMYLEGGVVRGGEEIIVRIIIDVIVYVFVGVDFGGVGDIFGDVVEGINVGLREEGEDGGLIGVVLVYSWVNVFFEIVWVVIKIIERISRYFF